MSNRRRVMGKSDYINPSDYFTIELLETRNIKFTFVPSQSDGCMYYSTDLENWENCTRLYAEMSVSKGQRIYFKGDRLVPIEDEGIGYFNFLSIGGCNLLGNCMSLLFGDEARGKTDLTGYDYAFCNLFDYCSGGTFHDIADNFLPATILSPHCYEYMFGETCIKAPNLPATTLAEYCYHGMFYTGVEAASNLYLTTAPAILPATTLAEGCYQSMFERCSEITTAPILPAEYFYWPTSRFCYDCMFKNCSKLNYIKTSLLSEPDSSYTNSWVYGVASNGTFVKHPDANWDVVGANGIPTGWTVEYEY